MQDGTTVTDPAQIKEFMENANAMFVTADTSHPSIAPHFPVAVARSCTQSHDACINCASVSCCPPTAKQHDGRNLSATRRIKLVSIVV